MPRFAANLGFTPLEPMKPTAATILRPTQAVRATQPPPIDVPAAQFDWSGAGLVNPLDGKSTDTRTIALGFGSHVLRVYLVLGVFEMCRTC